jgi:hypothetical protein
MTPCADAMIVADCRATDIILREHNAYSTKNHTQLLSITERMIRIANILFDIKVRWARIEYCIFGEFYLRPNEMIITIRIIKIALHLFF